MADFLEGQAKRLYGLGELEAEALVVRQTERGENLDADLLERVKAVLERYDRAMMRGHEAAASFRSAGTKSDACWWMRLSR